jgi:hypothetical protein
MEGEGKTSHCCLYLCSSFLNCFRFFFLHNCIRLTINMPEELKEAITETNKAYLQYKKKEL